MWWAEVAGGGGTEASLSGLPGRLTTGAMSQSPSHPSVSLGGLAEAQGRGIRGAFVPSLAVLSLIREVGQREKNGGPCGRGRRRPGRDWR